MRVGHGQHLRGEIDADDGAGCSNGFAKSGHGTAGAAADIHDDRANGDCGLANRSGVGGPVVAELRVPAGGPGGEEGRALGQVPAAGTG
jgi:hypothetical protein